MTKLFSLFIAITLFGCSTVHFDHPMPQQGNKIKNFQDLSGTYSFIDTTFKTKDEVYYNATFYKDAYKKRDSITLISGIIYFEDQQMGYKFHLKTYYNLNKVDTTHLIADHKKAKKTIEKNYLIFEEDHADTLINLAKKDELKMFNGNYYLNKYEKDNQWDVFQVSLKEDVLYLGIANAQDNKDLTNYTIRSNKILSVVHMEDDIFSNYTKSGGFKTRLTFKKHGTSH